MTYVQKREFAAQVFAAVLEYASPGGDWWTLGEAHNAVRLLAQAQLDALVLAGEAEDAMYDPSGKMDIVRSVYRPQIDAAYALAVQLAPLVGVEVME